MNLWRIPKTTEPKIPIQFFKKKNKSIQMPVQAYRKDIAVSIPDNHNKVNNVIK